MTKSKRGRYTLEFKQEAVRLVESGQSPASVSRTLGAVEQTLGNWVKAHRAASLQGAGGKAQVTAEQMEISRLCAELARVTMERDILHPTDEDLSAGTPAWEKRRRTLPRGRSEVRLCGAPQACMADPGAVPGPQLQVFVAGVECRVLRVSVSGYHQHVRRRRQIAQRRHLSDAALLVHIRAVFAAHRGAYGWPRVWRQLLSQDIRVGKSRVQRLMQSHGIRARGKRRFRINTTDSRQGLPIAPNLLDRNFTVAAPNQAWAGDVTYIPTEEGWLFLAVVMDLFSRRIVGWSMHDNMRSEIVIDALEMAWFQRSPDKKRGADLPQRLRQSVPGSPRTRLRPWGRVCQPRVQTGAQRAPNHTLHEPQGQMLG